MATVGIGLIGCGGMGRHVARLLQNQDARLEVRGLCDPDPRSIEASLRDLNPAARVYEDHRDLSAAPDIDWVLVASWNCCHSDPMLERAPGTVGMSDAITSAVTCFAIDEALNTGTVVDVHPYWRRVGPKPPCASRTTGGLCL
jgi:homoserine dehydrogenase